MKQQVEWEEQKEEEEYRQRLKLEAQAVNREHHQKIVWDDEEERKCQERYRQKYSTH